MLGRLCRTTLARRQPFLRPPQHQLRGLAILRQPPSTLHAPSTSLVVRRLCSNGDKVPKGFGGFYKQRPKAPRAEEAGKEEAGEASEAGSGKASEASGSGDKGSAKASGSGGGSSGGGSPLSAQRGACEAAHQHSWKALRHQPCSFSPSPSLYFWVSAWCPSSAVRYTCRARVGWDE